MKPRNLLIIAGAVLVAAVAFLLWPAPESLPVPKTTIKATADGMSLKTTTDPKLVFQKALWRQPAGDDQILHAERREWSTSADGVRQWRWFLAVKPGPALREWLAGNPFSLRETSSPADLDSAPAWFPKASKEFIVQQKADGHLTFMWSADRQSLYASDSGYGFASPSAGP